MFFSEFAFLAISNSNWLEKRIILKRLIISPDFRLFWGSIFVVK